MFNDIEIDSMEGYISKKTILEQISQEDIFRMVFGDMEIEIGNLYVSPFREDINAGCFFSYSPTDTLYFVDFSGQTIFRGKKCTHIDCFLAVQIYYDIKSFYKTLEFIRNRAYIAAKRGELQKKSGTVKKKNIVSILSQSRAFNSNDKKFWFDRYGITKAQLQEDLVSPLSKCFIIDPERGNKSVEFHSLAYCYSGFEGRRCKIYQPFNKKYKFLSSCTKDDIGGLNKLEDSDRKLVITKSYKDYRVLKNRGLDVIWVQSETMQPMKKILFPVIKDRQEVIIFFDNDETGIKNSSVFAELINKHLPNKARPLYLPEKLLKENIKDPSDLVHKKGGIELLKFINAKI